jgi:hypothetical protein
LFGDPQASFAVLPQKAQEILALNEVDLAGLSGDWRQSFFPVNDKQISVRIDSRLLLPARSRCLMKMLPVWYGNNGRQEEATEHGKQARTDGSGSDALPEEHTEPEGEHS